MPRKFKIGFAVPPVNDIDVYTQDLGFIAIGDAKGLLGFNVAIGGGMGRTDRVLETYPRLADVIGYVPASALLATVDAVMSVQRDYGDRRERAHARFKYTIEDKGVDWVKAEIERRLGFALQPPRPYRFTSNGDDFGWAECADGSGHYTLFVENGRIGNRPGCRVMDGLREIARHHRGTFRLTPNQNVIIAGVSRAERARIQALLDEHGLEALNRQSALRLSAIACVALPTCGLAMAESERYLPSLISRIETLLEAHGLAREAITLRMSGCPNGCSRPYVAEIGLTGRAPGKYNVYLGGGFHGERLNKMYLENVNEATILDALDAIIAHYARDRLDAEHFGDFVIRTGYVPPVTQGRRFND
jgi:sulfite reductase (NADPH) hemoprotein beta-component